MRSLTYDYPVRNYFGEGAIERALDGALIMPNCARQLSRNELFDLLVSCR